MIILYILWDLSSFNFSCMSIENNILFVSLLLSPPSNLMPYKFLASTSYFFVFTMIPESAFLKVLLGYF